MPDLKLWLRSRPVWGVLQSAVGSATGDEIDPSDCLAPPNPVTINANDQAREGMIDYANKSAIVAGSQA